MSGQGGWTCGDRLDRPRLSRRALLRGAGGLVGGFALAAGLPRPVQAKEAAMAGTQGAATAGAQVGGVEVRWLGAGVVEVAAPGDRQIAYVDAWVWNNTGWDRFGVEKPLEYASAAGFAEYVAGRDPDAVLVLLSHDHGDHMGDFFELLGALGEAGVNVKAIGQSDLMRSESGLLPRFREAGLAPAQYVVNNGAGANFGGQSVHGAMRAWVVPAVHSTLSGYPAVGFILEIGGVRFYASGDTDLYGDLRLVGERYRPDVALVCAGNGPFTMGPRDAALACQYLGVSQAIPIHYAHNAAVLDPRAGEEFRQAVAELSPGTAAQVVTPGQSIALPA